MHDTSATLTQAVAELVSAQLEYEVLKEAFHEEPPDSSIRITAFRLPQVTHDSAALACIVAIGMSGHPGDSEFFRDDYVRPTLVNPRLYSRFYSDTTIHGTARDSIQAIFRSLVPHPESFLIHRLDTIVIKRHEATSPSMASPFPSSPESESPLVTHVLSKLGARRIWPEIVESDFDFSIIMLDTVTDSIYRALAIRVAKRPFDAWFRSFVKEHIPIRFLDKTLEEDVRKEYPKLWWLPK